MLYFVYSLYNANLKCNNNKIIDEKDIISVIIR